jgi:hypothetical protein
MDELSRVGPCVVPSECSPSKLVARYGRSLPCVGVASAGSTTSRSCVCPPSPPSSSTAMLQAPVTRTSLVATREEFRSSTVHASQPARLATTTTSPGCRLCSHSCDMVSVHSGVVAVTFFPATARAPAPCCSVRILVALRSGAKICGRSILRDTASKKMTLVSPPGANGHASGSG